jgi:anaerobic magnesium-protoporphyrin IX monomethyl ester cyclase
VIRILFLQDSGINESLAATEVSACLRADGHYTGLLLSKEEHRLRRAIRRFDPQLIVIPCPIRGLKTALSHAQLASKTCPNTLIVLAGVRATLDTELATQPGVGAVCIAEAEKPLCAIANALSRGEDWRGAPSLAYSHKGTIQQNPNAELIKDLDSLPLPDRDLYFKTPFMSRFPWKKFSTGRGCPHSCSFCWNPEIRSRLEHPANFVRRKSPERAVAEVLAVKKKHPLKRVHFSDDLFTLSAGWLEAFAPLYARSIGIGFTCNSTASRITPPIVEALKAAGCQGIAIGIESGNEHIRRKVLNKPVHNTHIRSAAKQIQKAGIQLTTFNMVGNPTETIDNVFESIALNREIQADFLRVTRAIPMPFSEMARVHAPNANHGDGTDKHSQFVGVDPHEMNRAQRLFRLAVRYPQLDGLFRKLIKAPCSTLLAPLDLLSILEEKQINGLNWREGLRYYRHAGHPGKRTANYVTLV